MRLKITISGYENIKNFNENKSHKNHLIKSFLSKLINSNSTHLCFESSCFDSYDKIEIIVDLYNTNLRVLFTLRDQGIYCGIGSVNRNGHNYSISMVLVSWYQD